MPDDLRDVEVEAAEVMYGETRGADQIQDVTTVGGGEIDVLSEVEALKQIQEVSGRFAVCVIDVNVTITKHED